MSLSKNITQPRPVPRSIKDYYGQEAEAILRAARGRVKGKNLRDVGERYALSTEAAIVRVAAADILRHSGGLLKHSAATVMNILLYLWKSVSSDHLQKEAQRRGNGRTAAAQFWRGLAEVAGQSAAADAMYAAFTGIWDLAVKTPMPISKVVTAAGFMGLFLSALNIVRGGKFPSAGEAFEAFYTNAARGATGQAISAFLLGQAPAIFLAAAVVAFALHIAAPWILSKATPIRKDLMNQPSDFVPMPVKVWTLSNMWRGLLEALGWAQPQVLEWDLPEDIQAAVSTDATDMLCPISQQLFVKPVELNGHLYELACIEEWILRHGRDIWGTPADISLLQPSPAMEILITEFAGEYGLARVAV